MVTPIRVAVGLMILGVVYGWLVGKGATPAILLLLPIVAIGFIRANSGADR